MMTRPASLTSQAVNTRTVCKKLTCIRSYILGRRRLTRLSSDRSSATDRHTKLHCAAMCISTLIMSSANLPYGLQNIKGKLASNVLVMMLILFSMIMIMRFEMNLK